MFWVIVWILTAIIGIGYLKTCYDEGRSRGSGYRQEKQNKQIIEELQRQNEELRRQNKS